LHHAEEKEKAKRLLVILGKEALSPRKSLRGGRGGPMVHAQHAFRGARFLKEGVQFVERKSSQ